MMTQIFLFEVNMNKREFTLWLNEHGVPQSDRKSNGGNCPDDSEYGEWLRKNHPIVFQYEFEKWMKQYE